MLPARVNAALGIMRKLSEDDFKATLSAPMRRLGADAEPPFEFFSYFDAIPPDDFGAYEFGGDVTYVWEDSSSRFQHVLFNSQSGNVFMVLVLELAAKKVLGHRLLDLNIVYGIDGH